ncbi:MAG: thermonuclease family protein, partial [Betaproteobacteria bacterium]
MRLFALFVHLLLAVGTAVAAEISGIVTDVQDGDTLTLANWQYTYKIRLADIDAPELAQERGKDSRTALREVCLLKTAIAT